MNPFPMGPSAEDQMAQIIASLGAQNPTGPVLSPSTAAQGAKPIGMGGRKGRPMAPTGPGGSGGGEGFGAQTTPFGPGKVERDLAAYGRGWAPATKDNILAGLGLAQSIAGPLGPFKAALSLIDDPDPFAGFVGPNPAGKLAIKSRQRNLAQQQAMDRVAAARSALTKAAQGGLSYADAGAERRGAMVGGGGEGNAGHLGEGQGAQKGAVQSAGGSKWI